ncbi:MAG: hypothetical protein RRC34_02365 [Lentisphaeria bacterium]|nr:hypothetical protein [Lentisphaeria bacterium]
MKINKRVTLFALAGLLGVGPTGWVAASFGQTVEPDHTKGGMLNIEGPILVKYGRHMEPHFPEIEVIIASLAEHNAGKARSSVEPKKEFLAKLKADLPDTKPELISIQKYLKDDPLKPAETK